MWVSNNMFMVNYLLFNTFEWLKDIGFDLFFYFFVRMIFELKKNFNRTDYEIYSKDTLFEKIEIHAFSQQFNINCMEWFHFYLHQNNLWQNFD